MEILFEDAAVVVAVKPCGVLSEASAAEPNMPALLGGGVFPVHRLDRVVSGVMVYAKTKEAAAALSAAVREGKLRKTYAAVVAGGIEPAEGEWRDYLFKDAAAGKSFVVDRARKGAKEAILRYRVTDEREQDGVVFTRVTIDLVTGRSHQIRLQFASRGRPLIGDGKYGSRVRALHIALFAASLSFPHPTDGKILSFSAPVPADFPWNVFGMAAFEIERKFLIAYPDAEALSALPGCRAERIEQTYLTAPAGETRRVRKVGSEDTVRYVETRKYRVSAMRAVEEERELSEGEYTRLLEEADPARRTICKTRYRIPHGAHTIEVDLYDFWQDRATAEVELASEEETFTLPPYLTVLRDVTEDKRYKNVNLAKELPVD